MKTDIEFVPYGEMSSKLNMDRWRSRTPHVRFPHRRGSTRSASQTVFLTFSHDLDETFGELFRTTATPASRLLIINEDASADSLISKILGLQIRTPQRFYVVEGKSHFRRAPFASFVQALLERLVSTTEAGSEQERILDARIENGALHVVSPRFDRLDVPLKLIPDLKNANEAQFDNFEIDEDGSFIYWPGLDLHLGWRQLQQLINPGAALKAAQKSHDFNKHYGKAVQRVREAHGLSPSDIADLSEKQVGRIEKGECRLTSNAIDALAKAHGIARNEYMKKLAETVI
jgi:hypothetical protein